MTESSLPERLASLPRPVHFVFGGGGSLGAAHVGMLNAIADTVLRPDAVIGTSVGAINAAVLAETNDVDEAADRLLNIWQGIKAHDIFPGNAAEWLMLLATSRTHVYSENGVRQLLLDHLKSRDVSDLALPFSAVATDFDLAVPHVMSSGKIVDIVSASAAIPTLFPMAEIDGAHLCDGGVVANVPVVQAVANGAKSLVVLDCIGPMNWGRSNILEVMAGLAGVVQQNQRLVDLEHVSKSVPVLYLPPPTTLAVPISFAHTDELIADSYDAGVRYFAELDLPMHAKSGLYGEVPKLVRPPKGS